MEGWKHRIRAERQRLGQALEEKRAVARELASLLATSYGVRKVYLFGSLASGDRVHEFSDIDLAVEGLAPSRYYPALAELWRHLPPNVELDLVPLEFASPETVEAMRTEGVLLHCSDMTMDPTCGEA